MDFAFTEEQEALRDLARKILGDHTAHDRLKEIEKGPDWFDHELWTELAKANLLGVALPATVGGSGLGFLELCVFLEEVGRAVAPVPVWPTLLLGALPVSQFGTREQRERLLPKVVSGEGVIFVILPERDRRPHRRRGHQVPQGKTAADSFDEMEPAGGSRDAPRLLVRPFRDDG